MAAGNGGPGGELGGEYSLPQNLDAELSVLGASMLTPNVIPAVSEIVRPHHFYRPGHQRIFEVIEDLFSRGEPVDPITVSEQLANRASLEAVGGRAFIHSLVTSVPAATNARYYAEIVRENYYLRSLIKVGGEITEMGYRREQPPLELIDRAEQMVFDISQSRVVGRVRAHRRAHHRELLRTGAAHVRRAPHRRVPDGLSRRGLAHRRVPALQPGHPGGASLHGQDRLRAERGPQRGRRPGEGRGHLQPGDVQGGGGQPDDVLRSAGRQLAGAPRGLADKGLEPVGGRLYPASHGAHLHRRQRLAQPHGDPRQGAASPVSGEEPGPHHRGLPAAHDGRHRRREPAAGDLPHIPRPQDPRARARSAGAGSFAAVAAGGAAGRQQAGAVRPARIGRASNKTQTW